MMIPPFACLDGLATRASWRAAVDSDLVLLDLSSARLWLLDFRSGSVRLEVSQRWFPGPGGLAANAPRTKTHGTPPTATRDTGTSAH